MWLRKWAPSPFIFQWKDSMSYLEGGLPAPLIPSHIELQRLDAWWVQPRGQELRHPAPTDRMEIPLQVWQPRILALQLLPPCLAWRAEVPHWERQAKETRGYCFHSAPGAVSQRFCLGEGAAITTESFKALPKGTDLKQSVGKFKFQDALKNNGNL